MAIPDEKYQISPTGGQAFPDGGLKPPCALPVAPRLLNHYITMPPLLEQSSENVLFFLCFIHSFCTLVF